MTEYIAIVVLLEEGENAERFWEFVLCNFEIIDCLKLIWTEFKPCVASCYIL